MNFKLAADVTVPCVCSHPVQFGRSSCSSCGRTLSAALHSELERRVESSFAEYRDAKEVIRRASVLVIIVGTFQLLLGVAALLLDGATGVGGDSVVDPVAVLAWWVTPGLVLFLSAWGAGRRPVWSLALALLTLIVAWFVPFLLEPRLLSHSFGSFVGITRLWVQLVVLLLVARAVAVARRLQKMRNALKRSDA